MRLGHEVHLLCQEARPETARVRRLGRLVGGRPARGRATCAARRTRAAAPSTGPTSAACCRCTCTTTTRASRCAPSTASPTRSWTATSTRTCAPCATWSRPRDIEAGFANHLLMGPVILARGLGDVPYAVKIHGSALEYTLKPHYQRFAPYASEGLVPARAVLVGSRHTAESLWAAMPLEGLRERTFLGPPGRGHAHVRAARAGGGAGRASTRSCAGSTPRSATASGRRPPRRSTRSATRAGTRRPARSWREVRAGYDPVGVDVGAPDALASLDPTRDPVVCFVGQADRLEGHRPAARRLAAGAHAGAAARSWWWSASAPTARGSRCCCAASSAPTSGC